MKKPVNKHIILVFAVAFICGCQKEIEPENLPTQDPMLVLNSVLYTGERATAQITSSKSILSGKPYKIVANAECDLYEDDSWVERLTHDSLGYYSGTYLPKADHKYTFKVNASGYPGIEASTVMPPTIAKVRFERYDTVNYNYYNMVSSSGYYQLGGNGKFKIWITDDPEKRNFYSFGVEMNLFDSLGNRIYMDLNPTLYMTNSGSMYGGPGETDDAELVNGKEVFVDVNAGFYASYGNSSPDVDVVEVFLKVSNISEEVYFYKQTVNQQAAMGPNFFAEPVLAYNNVKNGMGLLGSTNRNGLIRIYKGRLKRY